MTNNEQEMTNEKVYMNNKIDFDKASRTIAFDFDGVIHSNTASWVAPEIIKGSPIQGIREIILDLIEQGFIVVVFSSRARNRLGRLAIIEWLKQHSFPYIEVTSIKPHATIYIDDLAYRFTDVETLKNDLDIIKTGAN
jgi:hypothetical protein